jgi:hypothetical protein
MWPDHNRILSDHTAQKALCALVWRRSCSSATGFATELTTSGRTALRSWDRDFKQLAELRPRILRKALCRNASERLESKRQRRAKGRLQQMGTRRPLKKQIRCSLQFGNVAIESIPVRRPNRV